MSPGQHKGFVERRRKPRKVQFKGHFYLKDRARKVEDSLDKFFGGTLRSVKFSPWRV